MVWGAISFHGAKNLVFLQGKQDSSKYCQTLETGLLPFVADVFGESSPWLFQ